MSDWMRGARLALVKSPLEEQEKIFGFGVEIGGKVDGLNARDGMEIIVRLGQYLAKHPEGIRDGIHVEGQD